MSQGLYLKLWFLFYYPVRIPCENIDLQKDCSPLHSHTGLLSVLQISDHRAVFSIYSFPFREQSPDIFKASFLSFRLQLKPHFLWYSYLAIQSNCQGACDLDVLILSRIFSERLGVPFPLFSGLYAWKDMCLNWK